MAQSSLRSGLGYGPTRFEYGQRRDPLTQEELDAQSLVRAKEDRGGNAVVQAYQSTTEGMRANDLSIAAQQAELQGDEATYKDLMRRSQLAQQRAGVLTNDINSTAKYKSWRDIPNLVGGAAGMMAASALPIAGATIAGGLVGAGTGAVAGPAGVGLGFTRGALVSGGRALGGALAGTAVSHNMLRGENVTAQYNDPEAMQRPVQERRDEAFYTAMPQAAMDFIVPGGLTLRGMTRAGKLASAAAKTAPVSGVRRVAETVGGGLLEGGTETTQQVLQEGMLDRLGNTQPTDAQALKDSFVLGALGGGAMTGAGNAAGYALDRMGQPRAPSGPGPDGIDLNNLPDPNAPQTPGGPAPGGVDLNYEGQPDPGIGERAFTSMVDAANALSANMEKVRNTLSTAASAREANDTLFQNPLRFFKPETKDPSLLNTPPEELEAALQQYSADEQTALTAYRDSILTQDRFSQKQKDEVAAMGDDFMSDANKARIQWMVVTNRIMEVGGALGEAGANAAKRVVDKLTGKKSEQTPDSPQLEPLIRVLSVLDDEKAPTAAQRMLELSQALQGPLNFETEQRLLDMKESFEVIRMNSEARLKRPLRPEENLERQLSDALRASGGEALADALDNVKSVPGARADAFAGDGGPFKALMEEWPSDIDYMARMVDVWSLGFDKMKPAEQRNVIDALLPAYGTEQTARDVLKYYGDMRREFFANETREIRAPLEERSLIKESKYAYEPGTRGEPNPVVVPPEGFSVENLPDVKEMDLGKRTTANYRDRNPARPFFTGRDDALLQKDLEAPGSTGKAITRAEYAKLKGENPDEVVERIRSDLENRVAKNTKAADIARIKGKLDALHSNHPDRAALEEKLAFNMARPDAQDSPEGQELQALLSAGSSEEALGKYQVVLRESEGESASDEQLYQYGDLLRKAPKFGNPKRKDGTQYTKDEQTARRRKAEAIAETAFTIDTVYGDTKKFSIESMIHHSQVNGTAKERFLDSLSRLAAHSEFDLKTMKIPRDAVAMHETKKQMKLTFADMMGATTERTQKQLEGMPSTQKADERLLNFKLGQIGKPLDPMVREGRRSKKRIAAQRQVDQVRGEMEAAIKAIQDKKRAAAGTNVREEIALADSIRKRAAAHAERAFNWMVPRRAKHYAENPSEIPKQDERLPPLSVNDAAHLYARAYAQSVYDKATKSLQARPSPYIIPAEGKATGATNLNATLELAKRLSQVRKGGLEKAQAKLAHLKGEGIEELRAERDAAEVELAKIQAAGGASRQGMEAIDAALSKVEYLTQRLSAREHYKKTPNKTKIAEAERVVALAKEREANPELHKARVRVVTQMALNGLAKVLPITSKGDFTRFMAEDVFAGGKDAPTQTELTEAWLNDKLTVLQARLDMVDAGFLRSKISDQIVDVEEQLAKLADSTGRYKEEDGAKIGQIPLTAVNNPVPAEFFEPTIVELRQNLERLLVKYETGDSAFRARADAVLAGQNDAFEAIYKEDIDNAYSRALLAQVRYAMAVAERIRENKAVKGMPYQPVTYTIGKDGKREPMPLLPANVYSTRPKDEPATKGSLTETIATRDRTYSGKIRIPKPVVRTAEQQAQVDDKVRAEAKRAAYNAWKEFQRRQRVAARKLPVVFDPKNQPTKAAAQPEAPKVEEPYTASRPTPVKSSGDGVVVPQGTQVDKLAAAADRIAENKVVDRGNKPGLPQALKHAPRANLHTGAPPLPGATPVIEDVKELAWRKPVKKLPARTQRALEKARARRAEAKAQEELLLVSKELAKSEKPTTLKITKPVKRKDKVRQFNDTKFDPSLHSVLDYIALAGGLDPAEMEGVEPNSQRQNIRFAGKPLFRAKGKGMGLDTLIEKLQEIGYINANVDADPNMALELLENALNNPEMTLNGDPLVNPYAEETAPRTPRTAKQIDAEIRATETRQRNRQALLKDPEALANYAADKGVKEAQARKHLQLLDKRADQKLANLRYERAEPKFSSVKPANVKLPDAFKAKPAPRVFGAAAKRSDVVPDGIDPKLVVRADKAKLDDLRTLSTYRDTLAENAEKKGFSWKDKLKAEAEYLRAVLAERERIKALDDAAPPAAVQAAEDDAAAHSSITKEAFYELPIDERKKLIVAAFKRARKLPATPEWVPKTAAEKAFFAAWGAKQQAKSEEEFAEATGRGKEKKKFLWPKKISLEDLSDEQIDAAVDEMENDAARILGILDRVVDDKIEDAPYTPPVFDADLEADVKAAESNWLGKDYADLTDEQRSLVDLLVKLRGKDIKLAWAKFTGHVGQYDYSPADGDMAESRLITLSLFSSYGQQKTALYHEALHDFFRTLGTSKRARRLKKQFLEVANAPHVMRQLTKLLEGNQGALEQLKNPEERLAYMFQFYGAGLLQLGPTGQTLFKRLAKLLRDVLSIVLSDETIDKLRVLGKVDKVERLMVAFFDGKLANPSHAFHAIDKMNVETADDKFVRLLPTVRDVIHKVFVAKTDQLREFGSESLNTIAEMFYNNENQSGFLQRRSQAEGVWQNKWSKILGKYTKAEIETMRENMQKMRDPVSDIEKEVAEFFADIRKYMDGKGVKRRVGMKKGEVIYEEMRTVKDYFTRVWDPGMILKNEEEFIGLLMQFAPRPMSRESAEEVVRKLTSGDGREELTENEHHLGYTPFFAGVNTRILTFIQKGPSAEAFAKFQSTDTKDILSGYVRQAVHRAEYAQTFENSGEKIDALMKQAEFEEGASAEDIARAKKIVMGLEGTLGNDMSPSVKRVMTGLLTMQNWILLPLAVFSQMIDPLGIAVRSGDWRDAGAAYLGALKDLKNFITRSKDNDHFRDLAYTLGVIQEDASFEAMGYTHAGMFMSKAMRNANRMLFIGNGMQGVNNSWRKAALASGERYILKYKDDKRRMEELGLEASDVRQTVDGHLDTGDEKMKQAMFRFVDGAVVRPNAAHRSLWMSDPRFMLIAHLKQFAFSFQKVILGRVAHEHALGNNAPLMMLAAYTPVIFAADMAKWVLTGGIPAQMGALDMFWHSVQRSGLLGKYAFGADVLDDVGRNNFPGSSFIGPTAEHALTLGSWMTGGESLRGVIDRTVPLARLVPGGP